MIKWSFKHFFFVFLCLSSLLTYGKHKTSSASPPKTKSSSWLLPLKRCERRICRHAICTLVSPLLALKSTSQLFLFHPSPAHIPSTHTDTHRPAHPPPTQEPPTLQHGPTQAATYKATNQIVATQRPAQMIWGWQAETNKQKEISQENIWRRTNKVCVRGGRLSSSWLRCWVGSEWVKYVVFCVCMSFLVVKTSDDIQLWGSRKEKILPPSETKRYCKGFQRTRKKKA